MNEYGMYDYNVNNYANYDLFPAQASQEDQPMEFEETPSNRDFMNSIFNERAFLEARIKLQSTPSLLTHHLDSPKVEDIINLKSLLTYPLRDSGEFKKIS